ncbi:Gfo/Idh/MocA family protein [Paracoccus ravus]|uniref:Gfo/Idh/MocA family protein n=1 Tax=Paracoccus ravus TaxID=2447760 RepID=UPI00106E0800|nr:Gfo/Idh/MocA family oxidoreductase [Paracoccus ravus]
MADQIRLGIVGTGRMAARMMQALASAPDYSVQAVASRNTARATEFASAFGIPRGLGSMAELAGQADVDAIYVCSRPGAHVGDALTAIEAGKPVLVEKPLTTNLDDARKLAEAARDKSCLLVENLWCLALPAYRRLSERLKSQSYGKPVQLQFAFGYPVTPATHASLFDPEDGGALLDRGVYGVSLALHLLGPIDATRACAQRDPAGIDLTSDLSLLHRSGATSQITVALNAHTSNTATVSCTHGVLQLGAPVVGSETLMSLKMNLETGDSTSDALQGHPPGLRARLKANPLLRRVKRLRDAAAGQFLPYGADQYAPMLDHFRDLVRAGRSESGLVPLELSLAVQSVLDEARRQIRGGRLCA